MRDLESTHNEKLQDIAVSTLEKLMKNELVDELPDEVRMVNTLITLELSKNCAYYFCLATNKVGFMSSLPYLSKRLSPYH